jgi:hypothetical protein
MARSQRWLAALSMVVRVIPPTALRITVAIGGLGLAVWLFAKASL